MFKVIRENKKLIKSKEDKFIDLCENCMLEYFSDIITDLDEEDEEYRLLHNEQEKILDDFPNLRRITEDYESMNLCEEEVKQLIKFIDLNAQTKMIEQRAIFYKGITIAYDLLKKINAIK